MQQSIEYIYRDQSLLINEIGEGSDAFASFWQTMQNAMKSGAYTNTSLKEKLESLVNLKYLTSEYLWYMLTGALVTSISYNYLVNIGCNNSAKNMLKRRAEYNRTISEKEANQAKEEENKVVYTVTE
jgi:HSP90 family molecular chaperone